MKLSNVKTGLRVGFTEEEFNQLSYDRISMRYIGTKECWIKLISSEDGKAKVVPQTKDSGHPYNATFYGRGIAPELRNLKKFGVEVVKPTFRDGQVFVPSPIMNNEVQNRLHKDAWGEPRTDWQETKPLRDDNGSFEVVEKPKEKFNVSADAIGQAVKTINYAKDVYGDNMKISLLKDGSVKVKLFVEV